MGQKLDLAGSLNQTQRKSKGFKASKWDKCYFPIRPRSWLTTLECPSNDLWPAARHSGISRFTFCVSPDASLISRAVRMRAIRVEVKWTVLSSAMGMFIFTNRWNGLRQERRSHEAITTNQKIPNKKYPVLRFQIKINKNWFFSWILCVCTVYMWQCFCVSSCYFQWRATVELLQHFYQSKPWNWNLHEINSVDKFRCHFLKRTFVRKSMI